MTTTDMPDILRRWLEISVGGKIVKISRPLTGASRQAWSVDVLCGEKNRALFLLSDKNTGGGSIKDAAVLRSLADTRVPVPTVIAVNEAQNSILLERIEGRSDFPPNDSDLDNEITARHLMELTAALHAINPTDLSIAHLKAPLNATECARLHLDKLEQVIPAFGNDIEPFFIYGLAWLKAHIPDQVDCISLIHSDMGPGNFLYREGRVVAILDWEVAHFGDPMEDLAAISVRDMATPIGRLPVRFAEYQHYSGLKVNLERVAYYRALILLRNSLMISLGLRFPPTGFNIEEMTMYQALLIRGAALAICDCLKISRPMLDLAITIDDVPEQELSEISSLLGQSFPNVISAEQALRQSVPNYISEKKLDQPEIVLYFARRLLRFGLQRRKELGDLFERYPQPLES
jgi:aminoglycoside phosphotransferase